MQLQYEEPVEILDNQYLNRRQTARMLINKQPIDDYLFQRNGELVFISYDYLQLREMDNFGRREDFIVYLINHNKYLKIIRPFGITCRIFGCHGNDKAETEVRFVSWSLK